MHRGRLLMRQPYEMIPIKKQDRGIIRSAERFPRLIRHPGKIAITRINRRKVRRLREIRLQPLLKTPNHFLTIAAQRFRECRAPGRRTIVRLGQCRPDCTRNSILYFLVTGSSRDSADKRCDLWIR